MSVHVFENSEVPDRNKAYGNHSERSCLRHLEGLCYLGYPLDDTVPGIRLRVRGTGDVGEGGMSCGIWVKDKRIPLCLK